MLLAADRVAAELADRGELVVHGGATRALEPRVGEDLFEDRLCLGGSALIAERRRELPSEDRERRAARRVAARTPDARTSNRLPERRELAVAVASPRAESRCC